MQVNVLEYLEATARRFPRRTAVRERERSIEFAELAARASDLGAAIARQFPGSIRQPVVAFLPRSIDSVVAFLGALYSGNCYVPVDLKAPAARLRTILDKLQPLCVVTSAELQPELAGMGIPAAATVVLEGISAAPGDAPLLQRIRARAIDTDPAYIIHTSGSSGVPKGVAIAHRSIIDYIDWARECFAVDEHEVIAAQAPFHFDNSTLDLYLCLAAGATLELVPEELFAFPVKLLGYLAERGATFAFWVPSVLVLVANANVLASAPVPTLKKLLFAGEVMPVRQLNEWRRHRPDILYANLYGPTEITVDCTYFVVDRPFGDDELLPIGIPCRNSDVLVLDDRDGLVTGPDVVGELCVRGTSLALGYWNNWERTEAAFVQNPTQRHYPERIYRTGDLVRYNDRGELIFIGRKDDQIKHRGYRIELGEIDAAALSIPAIQQACAVYDASRQELGLFYVAAVEVGAADLRQALLARIPRYMLPTRFWRLESMPLTASGKVDRRKLTQETSRPT